MTDVVTVTATNDVAVSVAATPQAVEVGYSLPGAGYLPLNGGTLSGPLEISTGTTGNMLAIGGPPSAVTEALEIVSSASQQNRLKMASFFETDSFGTAEVVRMHFGQATGSGAAGGDSSKAALAWYDDEVSTTQSQVWVQAHNYLQQYDPQTFLPSGVNTGTGVITYTPAGIPPINAWQVQFSTTGTLPGGVSPSTDYYVDILSGTTFSVYNDSGLTEPVTLTSQGTGTHTMTPQLSYNNNHHQHFSVEVTDSGLSDKSTRFSIPWGFDTTEIGFFSANVTVEGGIFRVCGPSGTYRQMVLGQTLSSNLTPDGTQDRWSIQANATAESGSNVGSDFRIVRYNDSGSQIDFPLFIERATGQIALGNTQNESPAATVDVESTSSYDTLRLINQATGNPTSALLHGETADTSRRYLDLRVTGDAVSDTTLYRSGTTFLSTDGYFSAGDNICIGTQGDSLSSGLVGGLVLANAATPPTGNPSGGGVLYVSSGSLYYRGTAGSAFELSEDMTAWGAADAGLIAWNYDPALCATEGAPVTENFYLIAVIVRAPVTVTNALLYVEALGSSVSAAAAGLYNSSGTQLGYSASMAAAWATGGNVGLQTMPLTATSSGSLAITAGTYYVGFFAEGSGLPSLARLSTVDASSANIGTTAATSRFAINGTTVTTLPGGPITMSSNTPSSTKWWAGLS
jgi:hypothetical protein